MIRETSKKKEIKSKIEKNILKRVKKFCTRDLVLEFFGVETRSDEINKHEWEITYVYASEVICTLERAGEVKFVASEKPKRGSINRKMYRTVSKVKE